MLTIFQIVTVMTVALSAALSVAHALEFPGKKRLDRQTYVAVQRIYYPGFTIGGIGDVLGTVLTAVLLVMTPMATAAFWLVLTALVGMLAMNAVFWIFTQPVNRYWVEDLDMGSLGTAFFGWTPKREGRASDWTELRDQWEYSHVARAVLASISLLALVTSLAIEF